MTSTTIVHQGPSPEDDYGLDAVAQHNAETSAEHFPAYHEDAEGLGIYGDYAPVYQEEQSYVHNPPTPRSNTASEGVRTRSGRSTRRTDSPLGTNKSRVSKSPAPRSKREKKSKLDRSKTPKLTAPLSVLTKDMSIPLRDIEAYVNRPVEERIKEMEDKKYVTRPMNSFMLYRSAYKDRTKQWCSQNNHQIISSVTGESWPMEPDEVRNRFDDWAKTERQHHQEAHPTYKFSPSKSSNKRRKGQFSDDEGEPSDLDGDPDGEYRAGRNVRQRRQDPREAAYLNGTVGFESHPYYGHQLSGYEQSQYHYANPGRPLPSNVAYDPNGLPYNPQTNQYLASGMHHQQYQYMQPEMHGGRASTPATVNGQQSLGGFGLPGGQASGEDIFSSSRTSTPMQHYQQQYGQPIYSQYQAQYPQQAYQSIPSAPTPTPGSQMFEHQQYLQQASQPQAAIDPSLEAAMEAAAAASGGQGGALAGSHFDDALGDMAAATDLGALSEYYDHSSRSPVDVNATLAPTWSPSDLNQ
ncbi:Hypothetical predicted protein [Lecanosticta acicola]|uniref:HMG box domain-containing protein n=1 Tax=Lecanosticta acicola TaxID=111012 RepID=A0AAI9EDF6_9PEZI|nr:Hypothetical predicted protein [Lecanosticta acicola]